MGPIVFLLGLMAGSALFALLARAQRTQNSLLLGSLWMGSLIAIMAFLTLPWITPGPPGTFDANVEWLARQGHRLEPLKQLPPVHNLIDTALAGTPQNVMHFLDTRETTTFLRQVMAGQAAYGWNVWRMSWLTRPTLGLGLTLAMVASLLGIVTVVMALRSQGSSVRIPGLLVGAFALAALALSSTQVPALDSLGNVEHLQLRLIGALGAVRINTGAWWMCLGLLIIAGAGTACFLLSELTDSPAESDDLHDAW